MARLSDINLLSVGNTITMTGAIYSGEGKTYLAYFPGEKEDHPIEALDMDSGDWETFIRQTDLLETEVLTKASDGKLVKVIARKSQRQVEQGISWRVFKRDGYRCRYCAKDDVPLTVDHLVLWEEQGPSIEANLVSACRKCNKVRGNTTYAEWLKHPYYVQVSAALDEVTRRANEAVLSTLDGIPRMVHARSR
jgi:hypothetical protein